MLQLRNILMVCTLFATGTAYIGARAFPTVFLDDKYSNELFRLNVRSPARRGCPNAFKHAVNLTIPAGALCLRMQSSQADVTLLSHGQLMCDQPFTLHADASQFVDMSVQCCCMPVGGALT